MKDSFEDYEKSCAQIREENDLLLDGFGDIMRAQPLAASTIRKHQENVDFFINTFLLYREPIRPEEGIRMVGEYLGDWFIRKGMWSSPQAMKSTAASLHKFYAFLAITEKITLKDYYELKRILTANLVEWQARCRRYNDGDDDWMGFPP